MVKSVLFEIFSWSPVSTFNHPKLFFQHYFIYKTFLKVFEEWRQTKQNRTQRANDYPENLPVCY